MGDRGLYEDALNDLDLICIAGKMDVRLPAFCAKQPNEMRLSPRNLFPIRDCELPKMEVAN